jgi:hypothetical protein
VKSHKAPKLRQANREKKPTPWGGVVCRSLETGADAVVGRLAVDQPHRLWAKGLLTSATWWLSACATWAFPTSTGP